MLESSTVTDQILLWIGQLAIYGGGTVALSFLAFRFLAENWLKSRFQKNLEAYRHENAKELESLRAEIEGTLNARIRAQDHEFEALSECHAKMNDAFGKAQSFINPWQSHADLTGMSDAARREYVSQFDLYEFQKEEIVSSDDPRKALFKYHMLMKENSAKSAHADFVNSIYRNEIYFSSEISDDFKKVKTAILEAITAQSSVNQHGEIKKAMDAWESLENTCTDEVNAITAHIRKHFFGKP